MSAAPAIIVAGARDAPQARPASGSAIYEGWVRHRRHGVRPHDFRYQLFMPLLDLDEVDQVLARHPAWSRSRWAPARFRRADYHGPEALAPATAVRNSVERATGRRPQGPVRMLAHLRYFGHCFNPVAFYYCYGPDGRTLEAILAEITNTPWRERHAYVLDVREARHRGTALEWSFDKRFHVSPFLPMDRRYRWRFQGPDEALRVHMEVLDGDEVQFDATLVLERRPADRATLGRCLWRYPPMGLKVVAGIYWQALLTWCRRHPFYAHPKHRSPGQP